MSYFYRPLIRNNIHVSILFNTPAYVQKTIALIDEALESIHFQTYIFKHDAIGRTIIEALKKAAQRGVKIYLLLDSFGSHGLLPEFSKDLKKCGIHFRFFGKFRWLHALSKRYYIGRRLHHKVLLIDQKRALVSGINVGEIFNDWFDFSVYLEGATCLDIYHFCIRYWPLKKKAMFLRELKGFQPSGKISAKAINNDGLLHINRINQSFKHYLRAAKSELLIISPYFFPSRKFVKELYKLVLRGVRVRILCNSKSDIPIIRNATAFYYSSLIRHGIEVYEWTHSILHGKAVVIDRNLLTLGSYNLNYMSYFTNIEMNVEIHSHEIAGDFIKNIENLLVDKVRAINMKDAAQSRLHYLLCLISFIVIRMISIVSVMVVFRSKKIHLDNI